MSGQAKATFYWAYCNTESKQLGNKEADETVAKNRADHHKRSNPDHDVAVEHD